MSKKIEKYYNILATEGSTEATMFLYGYIGPEWEFDYDTYEYKQVGITDIDFVTELNRLADQYPVINIRLNSPGGEIFHGSAIVSAILSCKAEVRTWNDGIAASMAAGIFLAGKKRYMAKNAMLMLHPAINVVWGNAADMREMADTLDKMSNALVAGISAGTGKEEEDVRTKYFSTYKDVWLNYADALADGLIAPETDDEYEAEGVPQNLAAMNYRQLVAHFHAHTEPEQPGATLMQGLRAAFQNTIAALTSGVSKSTPDSSPVNILDMNLQDFQKSLADGTLDATAAQAHLDSLQKPTAVAPAQPDPVAELRALVAEQSSQITAMQATITAFGQQPGAGKSQPAMPDSDTPDPGGPVNDAKNFLKEKNEAFVKAAETGANPFATGR